MKRGQIVLQEKLRGEKVNFECSEGHIDARKHLEGTDVTINTKTFHAKMLHSRHLSLYATDRVDFDSLYTDSAQIQAFEAIFVHLLRGHAKVFLLYSKIALSTNRSKDLKMLLLMVSMDQ